MRWGGTHDLMMSWPLPHLKIQPPILIVGWHPVDKEFLINTYMYIYVYMRCDVNLLIFRVHTGCPILACVADTGTGEQEYKY